MINAHSDGFQCEWVVYSEGDSENVRKKNSRVKRGYITEVFKGNFWIFRFAKNWEKCCQPFKTSVNSPFKSKRKAKVSSPNLPWEDAPNDCGTRVVSGVFSQEKWENCRSFWRAYQGESLTILPSISKLHKFLQINSIEPMFQKQTNLQRNRIMESWVRAQSHWDYGNTIPHPEVGKLLRFWSFELIYSRNIPKNTEIQSNFGPKFWVPNLIYFNLILYIFQDFSK